MVDYMSDWWGAISIADAFSLMEMFSRVTLQKGLSYEDS
jgi:hypothetical protein